MSKGEIARIVVIITANEKQWQAHSLHGNGFEHDSQNSKILELAHGYPGPRLQKNK